MQAVIGRYVIAVRSVGTPRSGWRVYALDRFGAGRRYLTRVESDRVDSVGLVASANEVLAVARHSARHPLTPPHHGETTVLAMGSL
jgi:hypothetical protein